jgi:hypothetical protein
MLELAIVLDHLGSAFASQLSYFPEKERTSRYALRLRLPQGANVIPMATSAIESSTSSRLAA